MDNIAYCGINCNACSFRVSCQDKDTRHLQPMPEKYEASKSADVASIAPCPGCKFENDCGDCRIKACITAKNRAGSAHFDHCSDCGEFPCELILSFSDDGIPHHLDARKNLEYIRENGMQSFLEREHAKWICPDCGKKLSWYLTTCPDCGADAG